MNRLFYITFSILFVVITTKLFGIDSGTTTLVLVPTAKLEKMGHLEFGTFLDYRNVDVNDGDIPVPRLNFFLKTALTDRFEYDLEVRDDMNTLHSFNANIFDHTNKYETKRHRISLGLKNLGWKSPQNIPEVEGINIPIISMYGIYTVSSLKHNSHYHFGLAGDREDTGVLFLAGVEKQFGFGTLLAEWNGKSTYVGVKHRYKQFNLYLAAQVTKPSNSNDNYADNLFSIGISYSTNILDELYNGLISRDEFNRTISKLEDRLSKIEKQQSLINQIESSQFLDSLKNSTSKTLSPPKPQQNLNQKRAFNHMQRGLEFYYKKQYQRALKEYQTVTKILPNSSIAYTRMGSIYYQLGQFDKAKTYWKKALKLNPSDPELKTYLQKVNRIK